ncbi:penicillin-binding protein 2 [Viridibacillus sp. FSL H8-0123]|uniref:peptidoglycan D,D-transpeptidase FtsI family protein n=1 Tax=Viridibacillus sp. FSL H8-0123 TaxID=1928922 RepID=UPI00096FEED1|nr:penicillin-binding protein 2 [Viridibacillus sp. FSL H8-0123]OMC85265.1 penicillin-binding protein [Viridibacillus sp. FSL H8-0123]
MRKKNPSKKKRAASVKAKQRANLSFRMNILFFSIFLLFSLLILRLGYMQIVKGEEYVRELAQTDEVTVNSSVPRGRIYDRQGRVLVDNEPKNAITYTKLQSTTTKEMLETANKLAKLIKMDTKPITDRDKRDFWITLNKEKAYAKVSEKEQKDINNDSELEQKEKQAELDKLVRDRITNDELRELTKKDLQVLAIYRLMAAGYYLSPQIIKSDNVTNKEFAIVSENLSELPGVNTTTDWARVKKSALSILGSTTTPREGIPKNLVDYYLARDYSRNDRVGKSYIEQQYEEILQGQKAVVKNATNGKGQVVDTITTSEGSPGKELMLTIDSELQESVDKIVEDQLLFAKSQGGSSLLDRAFLVMMNPNTGEVLSMVGKKLETDENGKMTVNDYAIGTFTSAYEVGSVVKPATLLTGYSLNAIKVGETLLDTPINIAGTIKSSVFNRSGSIMMNDLAALERSSNVYMFRTAFRIAGVNYVPGAGLAVQQKDFTKIRNSYAQFGLGVQTGIDLPGEFEGVKGTETLSGKLLDLVIGQYDTFTPIQLAQYVSTIANGGTRIQPHLAKEIREPSADGKTLGPVVEEFAPKVLNTIDNSKEEINQVKEGMRRVYFGNQGSGARYFRDAEFTAAGKTGTAQAIYYGPKKSAYGTNTLSITHIGFAPYENPEIAYAVVVPWVSTNENTYPAINNIIAREAVDKYFEIQKKNTKKVKQKVGEKIKKPITKEQIDEEDAQKMGTQ